MTGQTADEIDVFLKRQMTRIRWLARINWRGGPMIGQLPRNNRIGFLLRSTILRTLERTETATPDFAG